MKNRKFSNNNNKIPDDCFHFKLLIYIERPKVSAINLKGHKLTGYKGTGVTKSKLRQKSLIFVVKKQHLSKIDS